MDQHRDAATTARSHGATEAVATEQQDAAGGITLKGRNGACSRARALAGMVLTSGIVITLSSVDTSVSAPIGGA
ncbi:hypothetical protein JGS22_005505 [Streptomyces sp. P38-E01]|uniref:Uncharacterized protein n=1 Tax=Streptomyces tardus TaxID=2780544 RepID=A0A949JEJ7_9ACTN|nr:hypothetical protein [Streptomyces tardus]MBU7597105.1 hypothetical protein [Streptomyces tardus]